jgi:hypothetical protein
MIAGRLSMETLADGMEVRGVLRLAKLPLRLRVRYSGTAASWHMPQIGISTTNTVLLVASYYSAQQ